MIWTMFASHVGVGIYTLFNCTTWAAFVCSHAYAVKNHLNWKDVVNDANGMFKVWLYLIFKSNFRNIFEVLMFAGIDLLPFYYLGEYWDKYYYRGPIPFFSSIYLFYIARLFKLQYFLMLGRFLGLVTDICIIYTYLSTIIINDETTIDETEIKNT